MIRIGPAGWTHPELARVWPSRRTADFDPLDFLGTYFGCIEVDVTAEIVPRPEHVSRWSAALRDHARTRLTVRVPRALLDRSREPMARERDVERFRAALAPLERRERLGALVATLDDGVLHGPSELRALVELGAALRPFPLVLSAAHRSWYESRALDALQGAGWALAHLVVEDRWDAPPARHRATSPVGMLRLERAAGYDPSAVRALGRRAVEIARDVEALFVIADSGTRGGNVASASLALALELKYVLAGERPVRAWRELVAAHPGLEPLVEASPADRA